MELGGEKTNIWNSPSLFLSRGRRHQLANVAVRLGSDSGYGGVEDHCVLLCSLLLGFGLDAYVCCGKVWENTHQFCTICQSHGKRVVETRRGVSLLGRHQREQKSSHVLGEHNREDILVRQNG
uniref:CEP76/DRC7 peptidase-like domain-containing protein n=1 Tax=Spongospora subterranea TaxID=70186 RepID=A0A0H5R622_9EUKA|eukprot:CRZ09578.1 hypothetical protein [Spongospora subterranea]